MNHNSFVWDDQNYLAETDENDDTQVVYTNEPRVVSQRRGTDSHWYQSLKLLVIDGTHVGDAGVAELPRLANVRCVVIGPGVTDEGVAELCRHESLRQLSVQGANVGNASAVAIARSGIERLAICDTSIDEEGVAILLRSPRLDEVAMDQELAERVTEVLHLDERGRVVSCK